MAFSCWARSKGGIRRLERSGARRAVKGFVDGDHRFYKETGVQLLEFDNLGKIVWQWGDSPLIFSLEVLLMQDGLNSERIHHEREGLMTPLP